jgi:PKD repeat protein
LSAQKITSYCLTQTFNFSKWVLEASNDASHWIILHNGSTSFSGRQCFNITNNSYYNYYRVRVTQWVPDAIREIAEVEFFSHSSDLTTQSTSYSTTTTYTTTTASTSSSSTTLTTLTTQTTSATTTAPPCPQPGFLTISESGSGLILSWERVSTATGYELDVRYNNDYAFQHLAFPTTNTYTVATLGEAVNQIQFRVRTQRSAVVSSWTPSEILIIRRPLVDFRASDNNTSSNSQLKISVLGTEVSFTDISQAQGSPIASREWKFYNTSSISSSFTTSTLTSPTKIYSIIGSFAVSLTVTDQRGRSSTLIKEDFILVGCDLSVDFSASIDGGEKQTSSIIVQPLEVISFEDDTTGGVVIGWSWRFYRNALGTGQYIESTLRNPPYRYNSVGSYAVELQVTGEFYQTNILKKTSFVIVSLGVQTSTTSTSSTSGSTTETTATTTETTTSPPLDWWRISSAGFPIADSFKLGYEPYCAFDRDLQSGWKPDIPASTETTTESTTTSTSSASTTEPFQSLKDPGPLWVKRTDVKYFRDRFIELGTNNNIYRVIRFSHLPTFNFDINEGTIVYDDSTEKFYAGINNGWSVLNHAELLHAITHGSGGSDAFFNVSSEPPLEPFLGEVWIDTGEDSTSTTASTTAMSTMPQNGNIAVPGPWGYGACSSQTEDHPCVLLFDGSNISFWQANNTISTTEDVTNIEDVLDMTLIVPPESPTIDDRYLVGTDATEDWLGKDLQIAEWDGSQWQFTIPVLGDYCYVSEIDNTFVYNGTIWQPREEWIGFYWTDRRIITTYRVFRLSGNGIPSSWTLQASRNGLVWTMIHSVRNSFTGLSQFNIQNATDFNYYRLYIDETHDGTPPRMASLEFFEGLPR